MHIWRNCICLMYLISVASFCFGAGYLFYDGKCGWAYIFMIKKFKYMKVFIFPSAFQSYRSGVSEPNKPQNSFIACAIFVSVIILTPYWLYSKEIQVWRFGFATVCYFSCVFKIHTMTDPHFSLNLNDSADIFVRIPRTRSAIVEFFSPQYFLTATQWNSWKINSASLFTGC